MINVNNENELKLTGVCAVKFYLEDCRPCKRLDTIIVKMEKEFENIKFYSINIDEHLPLAKKYEIRTAPTLVVFNGTEPVNKIAGLMGTEHYRAEFKKVIDTK